MSFVTYLFLGLLAAASAAPNSRVAGGDVVNIEEHPYVVSITYYYSEISVTVQRCVGSLVSSYHVITSGFCFTGAEISNMQVRAGSMNSLTGGVLVNVVRFETHEDYHQTPRTGDISVAFLESPLAISTTINVLYLPPPNYFIADGEQLKVVGWGFESVDGAQLGELHRIYINKLSIEQCHTIYADNEDVFINDNVICAAAPGKGMCTGDSGAPMVLNQDLLVGTFSYFEDCFSDDYPDVFTRVDGYTTWILEVATSGSRQAVVGENIIPVPVVL